MNKYVKVIDTNNKIVDALDVLHFVKWNSRAGMVDNCKDTDPNRMGLLSYDASTIWHLEGTPEFPAEREYITTNYIEIDREFPVMKGTFMMERSSFLTVPLKSLLSSRKS